MVGFAGSVRQRRRANVDGGVCRQCQTERRRANVDGGFAGSVRQRRRANVDGGVCRQCFPLLLLPCVEVADGQGAERSGDHATEAHDRPAFVS